MSVTDRFWSSGDHAGQVARGAAHTPARWMRAKAGARGRVGGARTSIVRGAAVTGVAALVAGGSALGAMSAPAPAHAASTKADTLTVHADQPFRPVTHVATGSLYGLATATSPADDLVEPIKPNTFVLKPSGGHQQPTGDILEVAPEAAKAGAKVVDRLSDYYPGWPYRFSWDTWDDVVRNELAKVNPTTVPNLAAYAPWNESDNTWNPANGSFEDFWTHTYRLIRSIDPTTPIQGPSLSDNISDMKNFLQNAVATDTVPDIIAWHELERSSKIAGDIATVTALEKSLGITPLPIAIEEYAAPSQVGIPGDLIGYIAKFERLGVHDAELAFWNQSGTLGDLLTGRDGSPNGAYWLYTWYADMSGSMVTTTPPSANGAFDAAAAVTEDKKKLEVITGGASGPTAIDIDGLGKLDLGKKVDVKLQYTPSYGRTTPVSGPITISDSTYTVGDDGSITVPVVMNPAYGYHIVVTPAVAARPNLEGAYTITNVNSGLALDTVDSGVADGTRVDQATLTKSQTQTWNLISARPGLYKVQNAASGLLLGAEDGPADNGAPVSVSADGGTDDQLWQLIPDGQGNDRLANYGTGLVLAVSGMGTDPGDEVLQWTDGSPTSSCTADGPRVAGKIGTAFDTCGSGAYISMPGGVVSGLTGDYTVSAWVKPAANNRWSRLFDIGTGANASMFLTLNDGSDLRYAITTSGAGGEQRIDGDGTLPLGTWSLVTVTVAGHTGTLYVNGKAVASNPDMTVHPADFGASDSNYIGKSQYGADPALNAAVDDVNIYDRALSAAEVATLASGSAGDGDVLHYAFDGPGGPTVTDSSGNGRDGTIEPGSGTTSTTATDAQTADHFWTLHKVVSDDATKMPGVAVLSDDNGWDTGLQDGSYDVAMNLWRGERGSIFLLYENGTLIASEPLTFGGTGAQSVTVPVTGKKNGTYVYTGLLVNGKGATRTTTDSVEVTQASPGVPVLSQNNHDGDGSYTVTANLWWGTNATSYRFSENGIPVSQGELTADTPHAQTAKLTVSGKAKGLYTYTVEFINAAGTTESKPITVTVTG